MNSSVFVHCGRRLRTRTAARLRNTRLFPLFEHECGCACASRLRWGIGGPPFGDAHPMRTIRTITGWTWGDLRGTQRWDLRGTQRGETMVRQRGDLLCLGEALVSQRGDLLSQRTGGARAGTLCPRRCGRPGVGTSAMGHGGAVPTRKGPRKAGPTWCRASTQNKTAGRKNGGRRARSESARKTRRIPRGPLPERKPGSSRRSKTSSSTPCGWPRHATCWKPLSRTWRELRPRAQRAWRELRPPPPLGTETEARAPRVVEPAVATGMVHGSRRELAGREEQPGRSKKRKRTAMRRRRELPGLRATRGGPREAAVLGRVGDEAERPGGITLTAARAAVAVGAGTPSTQRSSIKH